VTTGPGPFGFPVPDEEQFTHGRSPSFVREAGVAGEVGGAEQADVPAGGGDADVGVGPVAGGPQDLAVGAFGGTADQFPGLAQATADHEHGGVEDGGEVGEQLTDPPPGLFEQVQGERVAGPGRLGHVAALEAGRRAVAQRQEGGGRPGSAAACSRARRAWAAPLTYCSMQPDWPQPPGSPPGTAR
jgi:hypothetical protein